MTSNYTQPPSIWQPAKEPPTIPSGIAQIQLSLVLRTPPRAPPEIPPRTDPSTQELVSSGAGAGSAVIGGLRQGTSFVSVQVRT